MEERSQDFLKGCGKFTLKQGKSKINDKSLYLHNLELEFIWTVFFELIASKTFLFYVSLWKLKFKFINFMTLWEEDFSKLVAISPSPRSSWQRARSGFASKSACGFFYFASASINSRPRIAALANLLMCWQGIVRGFKSQSPGVSNVILYRIVKMMLWILSRNFLYKISKVYALSLHSNEIGLCRLVSFINISHRLPK